MAKFMGGGVWDTHPQKTLLKKIENSDKNRQLEY